MKPITVTNMTAKYGEPPIETYDGKWIQFNINIGYYFISVAFEGDELYVEIYRNNVCISSASEALLPKSMEQLDAMINYLAIMNEQYTTIYG